MKKRILAFLLVSITTLTLFCVTSCKKIERSQTIAEEYFLYYMKNNWNKIYDYLNIPESPFTTKEAFISFVLQNYDVQHEVQVEDYTISEIPTESTYEKKYRIEYMILGELSPEIMEIDLIKQDEASELEYKVSAKEFIAENYTIIVPLDSRISIDNVQVNAEYKKESTTFEDEYLIKHIFNGEHDIVIESDYLESVESTFKAEDDGKKYFSSFQITDESLEEMQNILVSMSNSIYNAAIDGKNFESIRGLYAPDCDINKIRAMYDNLYKEINKDDGGIQEISFSNAHLRSDYTKNYNNKDFKFVGTIVADFEYSYYSPSSNGFVRSKPALVLLPNSIEALFRYVDGRWQVEILYVSLHSSPRAGLR